MDFTDLNPTAYGGSSTLAQTARRFAERVAPLIVAHEVETRRYVPVFIDATAIEVDGELFEWARKDYRGRRRLLAARGVPGRAVGAHQSALKEVAASSIPPDRARGREPSVGPREAG